MNNSIESILSQLDTEPRLLEIVSTKNGVLLIEETELYRWIRDQGNAYYSILDKLQPARLVLPYLQSMTAVLLFLDKPKNTLLLGAGGGALLRFLTHYIPDNSTIAIDYDEFLIKMTRKYFISDLSKNYEITKSDALKYLSCCSNENFDLIFVDLFSRGAIPYFFYTTEFYEYCKKCSSGGVVVFNLIIDGEADFKVIMKLLLLVFNNRCLCLTVKDYKNIVVLAFNYDLKINSNLVDLRLKCDELQRKYKINFSELLDEIELTNVSSTNTLLF